jgi:hypothetical protein
MSVEAEVVELGWKRADLSDVASSAEKYFPTRRLAKSEPWFAMHANGRRF